MMVVVAALSAVLAAMLLWVWWIPVRRFRRGGLKYLTPIPFLGDMATVVFKKQHLFNNLDRIYKKFPGERFVGTTEFIRPMVLIRDLELAQRVAISDFEHFQDHGITIDGEVDKVFGRGFFALKGQEWKDMRATMSPAFSRSKMRQMSLLMVEVGNRILGKIEARIRESKNSYVDMDFQLTAQHHSFEVIASCGFGMDLDSQDPSNADFYTMGKTLSTLGYRQMLNFFGYQSFPKLMKILRLSMFPKVAETFFKNLMAQILKSRKEQDFFRPDFIDVIIKTKKSWSDEDLLAQALTFFIAGFDTVSAIMGWLVLELALNPHVQDKLVQEICEQQTKYGGRIDYDTVHEMTYLDMVIKEVLRLRAASISERICNKDYNLGRPNDLATEDYIIRKGEGVNIPMSSFNRDPKIFPDPERFDPERFSSQNRAKIPPFAFNPFGAGPRICVGNRFAVCSLKVLFYQLVSRTRISCCPQTSTQEQIDYSRDSISPRNAAGSWVRLTLR